MERFVRMRLSATMGTNQDRVGGYLAEDDVEWGGGPNVAGDGVEDGAAPEDGLRKVVPVVVAVGLRSGVAAGGARFFGCCDRHYKSWGN